MSLSFSDRSSAIDGLSALVESIIKFTFVTAVLSLGANCEVGLPVAAGGAFGLSGVTGLVELVGLAGTAAGNFPGLFFG